MRISSTSHSNCEPLCKVNVDDLIKAVSTTEWPEHFRCDIKTRPLVIPQSELGWNTDRVVSEIMQHFPGCRDKDRVITTVQSGCYVAPHVDMHPPEWVTRIHVPIVTNPEAEFIVDGVSRHLCVGTAYKVNTELPHSIRNWGKEPRIHLMFDVVQ